MVVRIAVAGIGDQICIDDGKFPTSVGNPILATATPFIKVECRVTPLTRENSQVIVLLDFPEHRNFLFRGESSSPC